VKQQDRVFFRTFLVVLAVLISIAFVAYFIASAISGDMHDSGGLDARHAQSMAERIEPVGHVAVGEPPMAIAGGAETAEREPRTGAELVQSVCAACHGAGVLGAPKIGDTAAWQKHLSEDGGLEHMIAEAIKGQGQMPPRGGDPTASDDEIRAAVLDMLKNSGINP